MEWMIAHNMGILLIITPLVLISWALTMLTEKIKKIIKKHLTK
jgi:hypothetical protein